MTIDLYAKLGVQRDATAEEIHKAFRKLSKLHHPDLGGDPEEFRLMALADDVLTDPDRRAAYDATGNVDEKRGPEQVMADAIATLAALLEPAIMAIDAQAGVGGDLIATMRQMLKQRRLEVQRDRTQLEARGKKLRKIMDRLTVKHGENHLSAMLRRSAEHAEKNAEQAKMAIEVLDVSLKELERYLYAAEPMQLFIPTGALSNQFRGILNPGGF